LRYIFLVADRGTFEQVSETVQQLPAPIQVTGQTIAQWLEQRGRESGLREGKEEGLRAAICDLCEVFSVQLTPARQEHLTGLDLAGLESLRAHLKLQRAWPPG
jgi:hypothetical protein